MKDKKKNNNNNGSSKKKKVILTILSIIGGLLLIALIIFLFFPGLPACMSAKPEGICAAAGSLRSWVMMSRCQLLIQKHTRAV